jgi:putative ABC transport system permease protein
VVTAVTSEPVAVGAARRRPRVPRVHGPSVRGRAWAGRGPLLLSAVVVALAALLAAAVPAAMGRTADEAVADAVVRAGSDAGVAVDAPFEREDTDVRIRQSGSAATLADSGSLARFELAPELEAALGPPVLSVTSTLLQVAARPPGRTFRLAYVAGGAGAAVTWTAGTAPGPSVPAAAADDRVPADSGPWPVRIGLSEADAAALGLRVGDRVPLRDSHGRTLDVRVSGLFRALDPTDPAWRIAPLLRPGPGGATTAGLLSAGSLPDGRLALAPEDVNPRVTFIPRPDRLHWGNSGTVAAAVVALKASSGADGHLRWTSGLDRVLTAVREQVAAAGAQAAVLLVGLVTTSALVLLLAADLLVRRRAGVLAGARGRGASLPGIGAELAIESFALAVAAGALGLGLARLLVAGPYWRWALPVVAVAALAGPVLGVRSAATALPARALPANRAARRSARRTRQLRRIALEAAVVLAAAGAFAALRQRGVAPDGGLLPALAPTLGAVTGGLVLLRLLAPAAGLALRLAARSRRGLPLLGAARAAATAGRPLPFLVLVVSSALLTYAVALSATERRAAGPLATGLRDLATVSAVVLLAFAVLGVVLGASASAPARGQTLARLRTLGLRPRETRQVAVGELLPPVLAGAAGGIAVGVVLAYASVGLLDLRRLTGERTDPALVLPPLILVPIALLAAVVALVVALESDRGRRERLGLILRAGSE